jgi:hypothetical protein
MLRVLLIVLAALAAAQAPQGKVDILPVADVRAGMKAVGYTIFAGTKPEPFDVEVVGVLKNGLGPKQDLIVVKVGGPAGKTGVAAGMSGSPVYYDGRLMGALAYRIGVFPNEPIGGITPAEQMLEINEQDGTRTAAQANLPAIGAEGFQFAAQARSPLPYEAQRMLNLDAAASSGDIFLTPIETPLAFGGFHDSVMQHLAPLFRQMGMVPVRGAGLAGSNLASTKAVTNPEKLRTALHPGTAIAGVLLSGDLQLTGGGTVTYNDGRKVLAFGHPFFNFGKVEIPMATAEVVTTVGSPFQPFKILNSGEVVGQLKQDRKSAILGVLGESAPMIPVEATLRTPSGAKTYRYEMFQNPKFTPVLLIAAAFNTLMGVNEYGEETTYRVRANIALEGYPEVKLQQLYAAPENSPQPGPMTLAFWLGERFSRIYMNPFEEPKVTSIKLDVDLLPERRTAIIEHVWVEKPEVRPGEEVAVRVFLRPYRGGRVAKDFRLRIPVTTPKGQLRLQFSDPDYLNRLHTFLQQNRAPGLDEIISLLNKERANGQIFVSLLQPSPTAFIDDKVLPSIPSSVAGVIDTGRSSGRRLTLMGESALHQESIPVDYVVSGYQTVSVTVK